jgi:hypothetical protein
MMRASRGDAWRRATWDEALDTIADRMRAVGREAVAIWTGHGLAANNYGTRLHGYLMRRLINADFEAVPYASVRWPALAATSVVFGLAHGALWLPGIAAGVVYGLLIMRRGQIGEAVVAHATSNALIAASVLGWNQWQLW